MSSPSDLDWPQFEDRFLDAVMSHVRVRSKDLWFRGRLTVEGDSGPGVAEAFAVMLELRPRRSVTMQCGPGEVAGLVIRSTGRSENGRALYSSGALQVAGSASDLVHGYEEVVSIVLRSGKSDDFASRVDDAWRRACGLRMMR